MKQIVGKTIKNIKEIDDYFKIGIEGEFSPHWFNKKDVIIYDDINPLNQKIKQIKLLKEQNKIK